MMQYIGFKLNDNEFTIPILKVREIINTPSITKLPRSPQYMKGIINLRGHIVPVIDLKELVNMPGLTGSGGAKVIVVSNRNTVFGMLVDSITSVVNIEESDIEAPEGFMTANIDRIEGVAKLDDRLIILLDTNKLVDTGEMEEVDRSLTGLKKAAAESSTARRGIEAPAAAAAPKPAPKPAPAAAPRPAQPAAAKPAPAAAPKKPAAPIEPPPAIDREEARKSVMGGGGGGRVTVRELHDVKEAMTKKFKAPGDPRNAFLEDLVDLMDAMASRDLDSADRMISRMMQSSEGDLYKQIGHVTRKLHESLKSFRSSIDPRIRRIADEDVPQAVDSLEYVIKKTEEAANTTLNVVEKYQSGLAEFEARLMDIRSPEEFVQYLDSFRESLKHDLTEIMIAQEFQDITGQTIRRVIELVNTIEAELVGLITNFGVKVEAAAAQAAAAAKAEAELAEGKKKVTQDDVEAMLKEFGF